MLIIFLQLEIKVKLFQYVIYIKLQANQDISNQVKL